ncbi:MAG: NIPSNAP family protein [Acidobacteriota bacterium]|nr:NIPSNAP family protein [Acidobacteriota bacterium]
MKRRDWITSSLAASAFAALPAIGSAAQGARNRGPSEREFYVLQRYQLRNGSGRGLVDDYMAKAAVPALNRAGIMPVGVFHGVAGPENPAVYVLTPDASPDDMIRVGSHLAMDKEYAAQAASYFDAPSSAPAYVRFETSLLQAFAASVPRIEAPAEAREKQPRILELRTYENPSEKASATKIKMFNSGEIDIFRSVGFRPVFFGQTIFGSRMPSLTYMLAFKDLDERQKKWAAFGSDPEWRKLAATPGYSDAEIVSNITNVFLSPAACSQI